MWPQVFNILDAVIYVLQASDNTGIDSSWNFWVLEIFVYT